MQQHIAKFTPSHLVRGINVDFVKLFQVVRLKYMIWNTICTQVF